MVRPAQRIHSQASSPAPATRTGSLAGAEVTFSAHQPPFGELVLVGSGGPPLHTLDWQTERPVALTHNVQRLTAPNPGVMTGPGTNSYLVGNADTGYIAIDPGPNDPAHLQRLWQAAGGDIRQIVCTHSHPDHSPGARPLQRLVAEAGRPTPSILGLPSAATSRVDSQFTPDRALQNHELLTLVGKADKHTLMAMHTPGHAANHVCLVLLEDGLLFSGDHVLNGSTTVIAPPDGNMNAYLDSLDLLSAACDAHHIKFILPAHGYVLGAASQAIAQLKAHRLAREAKVLAAMRAQPSATPREWVAQVYGDVPERMWPVAERSLMAHVERIQQLNLLQT